MGKQDSQHIEIIARGVCVMDGCLLACHTKGAANTYLPGGHIEFGESAINALTRELGEELGMRCEIRDFLGSVEHTFVQRGDQHCEINLVFAVELPGGNPQEAPQSREDYIDFQWMELDTLGGSNLEPSVLRNLIPTWCDVHQGPWWGSTYADAK